eukprot:m.15579 g.15579  ORF g.15579 m.15579 type:complete len:369 (-) comp4496_c0_seq1:88-1194(-)
MSDDVIKRLLGGGHRTLTTASSASSVGITDRQRVVLDIGARLTKIGFAGEDVPRAIIPSVVQHDGETLYIHDVDDEDDDLDAMEEGGPKIINTNNKQINCIHGLLFKLYTKHLMVKSHEHKVMLVRSCIAKESFYAKLKKVLEKFYGVPEVSIMDSHEAVVYATGTPNSLILHCGHTSAYAISIAQTYPIRKSLFFSNKAANEVKSELKKKLKEDGAQTVDSDDLEDIFVRACFAQHPPDGVIASTIPYVTQNGDIQITHNSRVHSSDTLFSYEGDPSLQNLIANALLATPIDQRTAVSEKIVLIGGCCHLRGFKKRLLQELNDIIENDTAYASLRGLAPAFLDTPFLPNIMEWIGASIAASLATTTR